ncbi:MAG: helix-turn-helix domain-containing protein [Chloroflexi bacterium]|nr:helix-turn-helix domain-containing protein [Chloroflexota bacterium]MYD49653.1 helix-turn-helix domain-containing protein [Chloroflexota bacterium]
MASEEGWVGIADVAAHLSVAKDSIYRWVDSKDFPAHRVGRLLRFRLSEVDEWVKSGGGSAPGTQSTGRTTPAAGPR